MAPNSGDDFVPGRGVGQRDREQGEKEGRDLPGKRHWPQRHDELPKMPRQAKTSVSACSDLGRCRAKTTFAGTIQPNELR
jgi:hypothetical protein